VGKPEGMKPLGRPRRRREDNIKMGLGDIRWGCVDFIRLDKDINNWKTVVNSVMNFRVS
jgi:hypothetical protein